MVEHVVAPSKYQTIKINSIENQENKGSKPIPFW